MRPDAMILVFWMLSFKQIFHSPLSSRGSLSSSLLSALYVVSFAYLRLLIFPQQSWFQLVLLPTQHFSWCMYSEYKLNKQGDNIQPWHTHFPIWILSVVPYPVLTNSFWPAYRFLRRQVRWSGIPISLQVKGFPAAAATKSCQPCLTLCDPIDGSPLGSSVPGILQARILEWVAISFSNAWKWKVKMKSLSRVRLLATPWTAAHQAPPSMGFSRQEYWSGVPLLSAY